MLQGFFSCNDTLRQDKVGDVSRSLIAERDVLYAACYALGYLSIASSRKTGL